MTDYRRTEQERRDDDAAHDDEPPTQVVPPRTSEPSAAADEFADDDRPTVVAPRGPAAAADAARSADSPATTTAAPASELAEPVRSASASAVEPAVEPAAETSAGATSAVTSAPSPEAATVATTDEAGARNADLGPVDSVARFIADPGLPAASSERRLDAPSRSLAALKLLDARDPVEPPEDLLNPLPPALPEAAQPAAEELPSVLLGPMISTRADATERVTAIPRTHPLANSIAPGGSMLSAPPGPTRRVSRWYAALAALALLAIGAGASRFLQSRGEHHAATGLPRAASVENGERREPASVPAPSEPAPAPPPETTPDQAVSTEAATAPSAPANVDGEGTRAAPVAKASARRAAPKAEDPSALRVAVGNVRLQPGQASETKRDRFVFDDRDPGSRDPDREAVIAAMNALVPPLRKCVGDDHGVADVTLTVRAPGVVSHALVEGAFAGSDKGSCIARTLRHAKLPRFSEPVVRIAYPFHL